jgi:hypothetical protein
MPTMPSAVSVEAIAAPPSAPTVAPVSAASVAPIAPRIAAATLARVRDIRALGCGVAAVGVPLCATIAARLRRRRRGIAGVPLRLGLLAVMSVVVLRSFRCGRRGLDVAVRVVVLIVHRWGEAIAAEGEEVRRT